MRIFQITATTDGRYIGVTFDADLPIVLGGAPFSPTQVLQVGPSEFRVSNSNYVIDVKEI